MNLLHLKYACEIERCGSINRAAKHLYISQPYLSNCLQSLEQSVGILLFSRSNRGVAPTEQGKDFLNMARALLAQAEMMEQKYDRHTTNNPALRIISIRTTVVMNAYMEYYKQYIMSEPGYESGYYEAPFDNVVESVYNRIFSLGAVIYYSGQKALIENYARMRDLTFVEIGTVPLYVILSYRSDLADKSCVYTGDLQSMVYVTYSDVKRSGLDIQNECNLIGMTLPGKRFYVSDRHAMLTALSSSDAFTIGHRFGKDDEDHYQLVSIPPANMTYRVHFGYICMKDKVFARDSKEQEFLSFYRRTVEHFV